MPTPTAHAVVAVTAAYAFPQNSLPKRAWIAGALCAIAPDLDTLPMHLGLVRGGFHLHRGFSHSLVAAAARGRSRSRAFGIRAGTRVAARMPSGCQSVEPPLRMNASISATVRGSPGVRFSQPVSVITTVSSTRTPRSSPGHTA